jgi:hypothetical protein
MDVLLYLLVIMKSVMAVKSYSKFELKNLFNRHHHHDSVQSYFLHPNVTIVR